MSQITDISLLPILSKVIEKVIHEEATQVLNDTNIFYMDIWEYFI